MIGFRKTAARLGKPSKLKPAQGIETERPRPHWADAPGNNRFYICLKIASGDREAAAAPAV